MSKDHFLATSSKDRLKIERFDDSPSYPHHAPTSKSAGNPIFFHATSKFAFSSMYAKENNNCYLHAQALSLKWLGAGFILRCIHDHHHKNRPQKGIKKGASGSERPQTCSQKTTLVQHTKSRTRCRFLAN